MKELRKSDKQLKDWLMKFIYVAVIASIALLLLNVMSQNKDGRRQIIDNDGGTEYLPTSASVSASVSGAVSRDEQRLAEILSRIKGVGTTEVMITYHDSGQAASVFTNSNAETKTDVKGVIVTADGAGNAVIKNDIINAVSSVFNIPTSSVMVFERDEHEGGF